MNWSLKLTYESDQAPAPMTNHRVVTAAQMVEEMNEAEVHAFVRYFLPPDQIVKAVEPPTLPRLAANNGATP